MSGPDIAGLAITATHMCSNLATSLYSIFREVKNASEDAKIIQDTLVSLHTRLAMIQNLFNSQSTVQDPKVKECGDLIFGVLERIENDLTTLCEKLQLEKILLADGSARLQAWYVVRRRFSNDDIKSLKERLSTSENHLQTQFLMLLTVMQCKTENGLTVVQSFLERLLRDTTATQHRKKPSTSRSGSVDNLRGNNSDLSYDDAVETWRAGSQHWIESIKDYSLEEGRSSTRIPSIMDVQLDDDDSAPTDEDSSRGLLPSTPLSTVIETAEETLSDQDQKEVLGWCKKQGYIVDTPNFSCDISDVTSPGTLKGVSPIHNAIKTGDTDILRKMLSWPDCNPNVRLQTGREDATPLLLACSERNKEAVCLLLDSKAEAHSRDSTGKTALHLCQGSKGEGTGIAKLLLQGPKAEFIDIDARDQFGKTAAHIAARIGDVEMLKYLFLETDGKKSADPNARQQDGSTALMVALRSENASTKNKKRIIDLLVNSTDLDIQNTKNENLMKIAKSAGDKEAYEYLKKHMSPSRAGSRRESNASTAVSRPSTQIPGDICTGCPKHCTEVNDRAGQDHYGDYQVLVYIEPKGAA
ncbi:ankyrin repeat protein [Fusarium sporotrichioides]|uniref:Ankyrin repeat protein n=1 Tax=Fusarium sporotrichioides TaxID=5514 RepID=A0A395RJF7_FUSSP|nr:ankyrin repeat protein [Fusarium sporotrichioides]